MWPSSGLCDLSRVYKGWFVRKLLMLLTKRALMSLGMISYLLRVVEHKEKPKSLWVLHGSSLSQCPMPALPFSCMWETKPLDMIKPLSVGFFCKVHPNAFLNSYKMERKFYINNVTPDTSWVLRTLVAHFMETFSCPFYGDQNQGEKHVQIAWLLSLGWWDFRGNIFFPLLFFACIFIFCPSFP